MPGIDALFAPGGPFFAISGPCVIESESLLREVAECLRDASERCGVPVVLKASYAKDNRTSAAASRGPGLEKGLEILAKVGREVGLPITSDVHTPEEAARAGDVLDVLQIPAFLCRQTSLVEAAARTGRPLNIKKGQFLSPDSVRFVVEKARAGGATALGITERGTSFGYGDLVVDPRVFPILAGLPVVPIYDATHSLQRPGGATTGGDRRFARALARAALGAGARAIFFETHPDPDRAESDRDTQLPLAIAGAFLTEMARMAAFVRELSSTADDGTPIPGGAADG